MYVFFKFNPKVFFHYLGVSGLKIKYAFPLRKNVSWSLSLCDLHIEGKTKGAISIEFQNFLMLQLTAFQKYKFQFYHLCIK